MQNNNSSHKNEQDINLVDLFVYLLSKWKWFLLSILIFGGVAWYHYAKSPLVFFRSATVIIKDPSNKTATTGLDRFDNYINKVNIANEILQFRSKRLMREVVQRLHDDEDYRKETGDTTKTLIASTASPFKFSASVLDALGKKPADDVDEYDMVELLHEASKMEIPQSLAALKTKPRRFEGSIDKSEMQQFVLQELHLS